MKHCIKNQLNLFEFHDSELSFVSIDNNKLVVSAKHLNIHKDTKENPHDCDMEIDTASISFCGTEIRSFEPMRAYEVDDEGNWYTDESQIIFHDKDAEIRFIDELKNGIMINCIDICEENNKIIVEISTFGPTCFFATFAFNSVEIKWDKYCKKAWYELHKQYKYEIILATPNGDLKTEIDIVCHEEDMYYQGKLVEAPIVNIGIKYDGNQIWGHGKDYLWVDAFADLQKQLPKGVTLKCCLTCRHGNMCPYGNTPGELFCTKDLTINSKEDMCNLFASRADDSEIEKRSRNYSHTCEDYQHQSWDHYTYNDYLYEFDK